MTGASIIAFCIAKKRSFIWNTSKRVFRPAGGPSPLFAAVLVLVVNVRIMRVAVGQEHVGVLMRVRLLPVTVEAVGVLVILIMNVAVCMRSGLMSMHVLVPLLQM